MATLSQFRALRGPVAARWRGYAQPRPDEGYLPPGLQRIAKQRTGTRSQRRGRRSLSRSPWARIPHRTRPAPLIPAATVPLSGLARKGRETGQRCGTLERHSLSINQKLLLINFDDLGPIIKPPDLP